MEKGALVADMPCDTILRPPVHVQRTG